MTVSWARLGNGSWGVCWKDCPYPGGTAESLPVTVTSKSGRKATVVLGPRERHYLAAGGRRVDIYRVATAEEKAAYSEQHLALTGEKP